VGISARCVVAKIVSVVEILRKAEKIKNEIFIARTIGNGVADFDAMGAGTWRSA
jgi:hypothetical protein